MKNWLVIANASRARVLEQGEQPGRYTHVADLVHPASRMKNVDLGDDRAGHVQRSGSGNEGAAYEGHLTAHQREHLHFAHEVAATVDEGVRSGRCAGVVLVASNPFLGELKAALGAAAADRVLRTVPADYTALDEAELARRLAAD